MKIAIVAPSPVPFRIGGAENLWLGLHRFINESTEHEADVIKLPVREHTFWELIDSYWQFYQLNLSHFDLIITGKYPAWMVRHRRHVCYMLHPLRGLYDTYHFLNLPARYQGNHPTVEQTRRMMLSKGATALDDFFEWMRECRRDNRLPQDAITFPGPFIREIVHFLDAVALSAERITRLASISGTVARRDGYFAANREVHVAYPPPLLGAYHSRGQEYLFTASRLDGPKRIALIVQAMRQVKADMALKIAGTGPEEARLRALADGDGRIQFLGHVSDDELRDLYAGALAIVFAPLDEDYGFITVEAMLSGKPVITTSDAGGPLEFVSDGQTGLIAKPEARSLAEKISYLIAKPDIAAAMGNKAREKVKPINWSSVVDVLTADAQPDEGSPKDDEALRRRKITVACTFPVHPPRGGGQVRVFQLYRQLARWYDVEIVSFARFGEQAFDSIIAPGLREIRIPMSKAHHQAEARLAAKVGVPVTDVAMPRLYKLTPVYLDRLRESVKSSDLVVASHPYLLPALEDVTTELPLLYEAHNVELELKKSVLPTTEDGLSLLEDTKNVEARCCERALLIYACASEDIDLLAMHYGTDRKKMMLVRNGVDLEGLHFVSLDERQALKRHMGLDRTHLAVFMGSWHPPNLAAVEALIPMAAKQPEVRFVILGGSSDAFRNRELPRNIGLMGVVDDTTKAVTLSIADVALNPMEWGSGTNLKMLEYLAAGVPVVSTAVGVRGLEVANDRELIISSLDDFAEAIVKLRQEGTEEQSRRVVHARRFVEKRYSWPDIAQTLHEKLLILL